MKKNKGFSLVELLAVIVILGIILSVSAVAVGKIRNAQEEENYKNALSTILTGAKSYVSDYPNVFNNMCDSPQNDIIGCYNKNEKKIYISVNKLIEEGYASIDKSNSLFSSLINNSNSVEVETCKNNNLKQVYKLKGRDNIEYNDCGCEKQNDGDSSDLCVTGAK